MTRPIPMIDDLPLQAIVVARAELRARYASLPVIGLAGDVQQALGRASHVVELHGLLFGETAADDLAALQAKVTAGAEVAFTADISDALAMEHMVVVSAAFEEVAGRPGTWSYRLLLRESPPLPEPASLGGFDDLGFGDLGDVLGDIADAAGAIQGAIDAVGEALEALDALASLGDLGLNNPLTPLQEQAGQLTSIGQGAADAGSALTSLLGGL